ncbi:membrane protein [Virgisporangium aliadipatigenens]|uniref:Membrane protein n=1 Tax=Virgisporangium aliadipatigenens TaxID=741659 RepID=A0A8J3YG66_9ACTN|nr:DUF418 domain-containing protein [Virgisporangium aliadipatigenens]GIJ43386.1 membrane protein [Virgisporangium aliadipatigenens]
MERAERIVELDALRGAALAGIVMVNIVQLTGLRRPDGPAAAHPTAFVWELLFLQRPFPVFTFLFGVSFALMLRTASRFVLLRRLLWLGVIGLLHSLLQPNEVLRHYAAFGVVVLLPASYLPRRWVLGLGALLLVPAMILHGIWIIPGLFLLGAAAAGYGLPERRALVRAFAVALPAAAIVGHEQYRHGVGPSAYPWTLPAGLVFAFLFVVGFLLVGRPTHAVLAPMGRMALTNYVLASALILGADATFHIGQSDGYGRVVAVGTGIGVAQALLSLLWLRHFRHGPLEWLWRGLTLWRVPPMRR